MKRALLRSMAILALLGLVCLATLAVAIVQTPYCGSGETQVAGPGHEVGCQLWLGPGKR